jgi:hypothetical protein
MWIKQGQDAAFELRAARHGERRLKLRKVKSGYDLKQFVGVI